MIHDSLQTESADQAEEKKIDTPVRLVVPQMSNVSAPVTIATNQTDDD
jgi:hypothetical protein